MFIRVEIERFWYIEEFGEVKEINRRLKKAQAGNSRIFKYPHLLRECYDKKKKKIFNIFSIIYNYIIVLKEKFYY